MTTIGGGNWGNAEAAQRDPVTEALASLTVRDWTKIWCTRLPDHVPHILARQVQQMTTEIALRGMASSSLLGIPAWLCLAFFVMPSTRAARIWSIAPIFIFAYAAVVVPMMFRLLHQGRLTTARFNALVTPTVVYSGVLWGTLPLAVGPDNLGRFYLAMTIMTIVSIAGTTWLMGHWPLAMLYAIVQAVISSATFIYFDRPEAIAVIVMIGVLVLTIFAITVVGSVVLMRSLYQTVMMRDRQGMIELLLGDYERGGHDWIWETDETLTVLHIPPRMQVASCGDDRVRAYVNLVDLVGDDPAAVAAIAALKPFQTTIRTSGADGTGEIRLWGRPNMLSGRCLGYRGVGSDQGATRRAADAERTAERLDAMVALTSGITHDFNNQLATVLGSVELAKIKAHDPDQVVGYLDRAAAACLRSRSMTADLGAALGLHAPSEAKAFNVGREARSVIADVAPLYPDMAVELEVVGDVNGFADPNHFRRALRNLVENACQANARNPSTNGSVLVIASARMAGVDPMACVRVRDDGPGISDVDALRIFEPYFTTRREAGGTGLGLAVAHGFCRQAGGSLTLDSSSSGATFVLEVPLAVGERSAPDAQGEDSVISIDDSTLNGSFLVVEDDENVASTLASWVQAWGASVERVSTVAAGVERVRDPKRTYRCVISDIVLPDGEGFAVVAALRDRRPKAPAIYVSGFSRTLPNALDSDLRCPFVAKPFSSAELLQALVTAGAFEQQPPPQNRARSTPLPSINT